MEALTVTLEALNMNYNFELRAERYETKVQHVGQFFNSNLQCQGKILKRKFVWAVTSNSLKLNT